MNILANPVVNFKRPTLVLHSQTVEDELFRGVSSRTMDEIRRHKASRLYKRGDIVFAADEIPTGVFYVSKGLVRLESNSTCGKTSVFRLVKEGEILGFRAFIAREAYHVSAYVHEDSVIHYLSKETISKITLESPEFLLNMATQLSVQLREADIRMESILHKDAISRVASALLFFKERYPEQAWTRKEISEWAGTTPETVIRILTKMKEDGLIEQCGRALKILNHQRLNELAQSTID